MVTITKEDLIGQIANFPLKIVEAMVANQVRQGNPANVKVFQDKVDASFVEGGFSWNKSAEGQFFWSKVINGKQFPVEVVQPDKFNEGTTGTSTSTLVGQKSPEDAKTSLKYGDKVIVEEKGRRLGRIFIGFTDDNRILAVTNEGFKQLQGDTNMYPRVMTYKVWEKEEGYVYLTLKDISEGKGVGVDPKLIRII